MARCPYNEIDIVAERSETGEIPASEHLYLEALIALFTSKCPGGAPLVLWTAST